MVIYILLIGEENMEENKFQAIVIFWLEHNGRVYETLPFTELVET